MSRLGTVYTYSIIHSGTGNFKNKTPYVVALVEENQQMRLALVEGYTQDLQVRIGMEVGYLTADERNNPVYRFI
ncbi:OB-fold domain-containing protein [Geobacter sp.]|uniref:Zn-ribbon domain-containing OB-fold protein n=1 Tax=Geobacter sp. TaxID=46610 RepID=UPI0026197366|nr:OB-fold domain-containing protein [Geobacter sp.]